MKRNSTFMRLAALASVSVAGTLIVLKLCAFLMTGALSILSSLIDSSLDLLVALLNAVAIHLSLKPADRQHRFGHGKAEAIGGFVQAIFLFASAAYLLCESYQHFKNNTPLEHIPVGVWVMIISTILTLGLTYFQKWVIKRTQSTAIQCDCVHYLGDTYMNLGVLASLGFSYWLKWNWIDELFAACVALYLFKSSIGIFGRVCGILMDKEVDSSVRRAIQQAVRIDNNIYGIYRLKTRTTGAKTFIQFHAKINKRLNFQQSYALCTRMEKAIHAVLPKAEVIIYPVPK